MSTNHPFAPSKRRRKLVPPPTLPPAAESEPVVSAETATDLLNRSLAVIMGSVGFSGATALAQERIRQIAEERYLSMLRTISTFAAAQRRTKPTIVDFEEMLAVHGIPLGPLEEEMRRFPSKRHLFVLPPPSPPPSPPPHSPTSAAAELLGSELLLGGKVVKGVEPHHPPFPSRHTYLSTPVFTKRPTDPRFIRERATEEARLAEGALRTFLAVGAKKRAGGGADNDDDDDGDDDDDDGEACMDPTAVMGGGGGGGGRGSKKKKKKKKSKRRLRDEAWRNVFDRLATSDALTTISSTTPNGAGSVTVKMEEPADEEQVQEDIIPSGTTAAAAAGAHGIDANNADNVNANNNADGETAFLEVIVNADAKHWRKNGRRRMAFV